MIARPTLPRLVRCPHCKARIASTRLESHIKFRCSTLLEPLVASAQERIVVPAEYLGDRTLIRLMNQVEKDSKKYRKAGSRPGRRRYLLLIGYGKMEVNRRLKELEKDPRFKPTRPIIDTSLPSYKAWVRHFRRKLKYWEKCGFGIIMAPAIREQLRNS